MVRKNTLVNSKMIKEMDMECLSGKMEEFMMDCGKMANSMEEVFLRMVKKMA